LSLQQIIQILLMEIHIMFQMEEISC
jgi:hypothetical protein